MTARTARSLSFAVAAALLFSLAGCGPKDPQQSYNHEDPAAAEFDAGAGRAPTVKTLYSLAKILAAQGKDAECANVLARIIADHPEFVPAYCELAELHMRGQCVDEAIVALTRGLRVAPRNPILLNDLGMCRLFKRQYPQALEMFTQASAASPRDVRYRTNMAVALGMSGRYEEAMSLYRQSLTAAQTHYNMGVLCQARNDKVRADEEFQRARQLDPKLKP